MFRSLSLWLWPAAFLAPAVAQVCKTQSQPNPISNASYPITGTVNGTIALLPISYELARSIIPAQFAILKEQYLQWLPWLPNDRYPAILQTELDHDIYTGGVAANFDFQVSSSHHRHSLNADVAQRASINFPFVDRLGDGYTAFNFWDQILITNTSTEVIEIFAGAGYRVTPAVFDPPCDAYEFVKPGSKDGTVYSTAISSNSSSPSISWEMKPVPHSPYSTDFWYNVTNQPYFSHNISAGCDKLVRLFNTSVSEAPYVPVPVIGNVTTTGPDRQWTHVSGLKLDQAFYEIGFSPCELWQGFSVVDAPAKVGPTHSSWPVPGGPDLLSGGRSRGPGE